MPERQQLRERILVYIQALPVNLSAGMVKRLQDLKNLEFRMSHSSKAALSFAKSLDAREIIAIGFPPVLHEALARGATGAMSTPLCDDPLVQAGRIPQDSFNHIVIGENSDWAFTGASLAGALAESRKLGIHLFQESDAMATPANMRTFPSDTIILVKESGKCSEIIDVRRIKSSAEVHLMTGDVVGTSTLSKLESKRNELISGNTADIVSALSRRIARLTRGLTK